MEIPFQLPSRSLVRNAFLCLLHTISLCSVARCTRFLALDWPKRSRVASLEVKHRVFSTHGNPIFGWVLGTSKVSRGYLFYHTTREKEQLWFDSLLPTGTPVPFDLTMRHVGIATGGVLALAATRLVYARSEVSDARRSATCTWREARSLGHVDATWPAFGRI